MNVYLYQNNTEKILKNAYIGEVWTPWSNTLGYYTFDDQNVSQITDFSGNNRNLTWWTMPSYTLVSGSNYSGNYAGNYANVSSWVWQNHEYWYMNGDYTMLIWVKPTSTWSCFINCLDTNEGNSSHQISLIYWYNNWQFEYYDDNAGSVKRVTIASWVTTNTWYLICYTRNWTSVKTYQNWNASNTITWANTSRTKYLFMWSSRSWDRFKWVIWDCIIENRVRTAQEISHYYDITKANYWL